MDISTKILGFVAVMLFMCESTGQCSTTYMKPRAYNKTEVVESCTHGIKLDCQEQFVRQRCNQKVSRYTCRSCQYQSNMPKPTACILAPDNMTDRVKCEGNCMSQSTFNKETMLPTFMFRGCSSLEDDYVDNCVENELSYTCYTTCSDNFCNVDWGFVGGADRITNSLMTHMCVLAIGMLIA